MILFQKILRTYFMNDPFYHKRTFIRDHEKFETEKQYLKKLWKIKHPVRKTKEVKPYRKNPN